MSRATKNKHSIGKRGIAFCLPLFWLAGAVPLAASDTQSADFCARLAADNGIEVPAATNGRTVWTANALNFGQRFLFGGTAATGLGVTPIDPVTVEDYRRLENMCMPGKKSATCKLVGPVNFEFIWKGRKVVTPMKSGERATVTIVSTKTTCQSEAP